MVLLGEADGALNDPRFRDSPVYIFDSLQWVKLASLLRLEKTAEARSLAERLSSSKPANELLAKFAGEIAAGREPGRRFFRIAYEFFSGDIGERPN